MGRAEGYASHPQLERFRKHPQSLHAIGEYLWSVNVEARRRNYRFDSGKIEFHNALSPPNSRIPTTTGQVIFEREHLRQKLIVRGSDRELKILTETPYHKVVHPLFEPRVGFAEPWEKME